MRRHYYISDNLNELETLEHELEDGGICTPQIHILSENAAEVDKRQLHKVESVLQQDVVHSTEIGALVGAGAAVLVLAGAYFLGLTGTPAGWVPVILLSIIVMGFCTWEGGLFGIQEPHRDFRRFENVLHQGKHVFFVDIAPDQESVLERVVKTHPRLQLAGTGPSTPHWALYMQQKWREFIHWAP